MRRGQKLRRGHAAPGGPKHRRVPPGPTEATSASAARMAQSVPAPDPGGDEGFDLESLGDVGDVGADLGEDPGDELPWLGFHDRRLKTLEEPLRGLLESLRRPEYEAPPAAPFRQVLLRALLALYDPRLRGDEHVKPLREFLRAKLPKCFLNWPPKRRGVKALLPVKEQNQIRPANGVLLALYQNAQLRPTPESVIASLRRLFPARADGWTKRWDELATRLQTIIDDPTPAFDKARETLACLFTASRATIDRYIAAPPRHWKRLGEE